MYNAVTHYYLLSVTVIGIKLGFGVIGWWIVNYHFAFSFLICIRPILIVREMRLELIRHFCQQFLRLSCLPIPALSHIARLSEPPAVPYPEVFIEASMVLGTLSTNVIRQLEYNLPNRNIQLYSTLFWSRQPSMPSFGISHFRQPWWVDGFEMPNSSLFLTTIP